MAGRLVVRHRPRPDARARPVRRGRHPALAAAALLLGGAPRGVGRLREAVAGAGARARRLPAAGRGAAAVRARATGGGRRRRGGQAPVGRGARRPPRARRDRQAGRAGALPAAHGLAARAGLNAGIASADVTVVDLHVRQSGSGPPVVLLHAFPLSSAMWLEARNDLGAEFRVVTPDLRGFGGSQLGDDEPSLDHMADDVAAVLDRLELDSVVLGGLSMGGYVAMAFLRRHPGRVRALLLADTKGSADTAEGGAKRLAMAARLDDDPDSDVASTDVLPTLLGPTTSAERPMVVGRVKGLVEAAPGPAVAWAQRAMAARPDSF